MEDLREFIEKHGVRIDVFTIILTGIAINVAPKRDFWFWLALIGMYYTLITLTCRLYYKPNHLAHEEETEEE